MNDDCKHGNTHVICPFSLEEQDSREEEGEEEEEEKEEWPRREDPPKKVGKWHIYSSIIGNLCHCVSE